MRALYIFPHPDDESFGPAPAIASQLRAGHEVHLLTYTRGGATKVRHKYGYSVEEMGKVRYHEMQNVSRTLGLSSLEVLDLPDSGLKHMDPIDLEQVTENHIRKIRPDVIVTYAVHGISGFHDHLVSHAVVKRVFCKLRNEERSGSPRRLAFFTLAHSEVDDGKFRLQVSTEEEIDCATRVDDEDIQKGRIALDCYKTYQDVIKAANVLERTGRTVYFEFFQENYNPHALSLFQDISPNRGAPADHGTTQE